MDDECIEGSSSDDNRKSAKNLLFSLHTLEATAVTLTNTMNEK